jgi:hypothetical protein
MAAIADVLLSKILRKQITYNMKVYLQYSSVY